MRHFRQEKERGEGRKKCASGGSKTSQREGGHGRRRDSSPHPWPGINILSHPVSCWERGKLQGRAETLIGQIRAGESSLSPRDQAGEHAREPQSQIRHVLHVLQIPGTVPKHILPDWLPRTRGRQGQAPGGTWRRGSTSILPQDLPGRITFQLDRPASWCFGSP